MGGSVARVAWKRSSAPRARQGRAGLSVLVLVWVLVGCAAPPSQGWEPPVGPDSDVWITGDSNSRATGATMRPQPYIAGQNAGGFTDRAATSLLEGTLAQMDAHGTPPTLVVMGGVTDIPAGVAATTAAMAGFEAAMSARGARVVWVAEPAWQFAAEMQPVSAWVLSRPGAIDCRGLAGSTYDGLHMTDPAPFADCVTESLARRGITVPD